MGAVDGPPKGKGSGRKCNPLTGNQKRFPRGAKETTEKGAVLVQTPCGSKSHKKGRPTSLRRTDTVFRPTHR